MSIVIAIVILLVLCVIDSCLQFRFLIIHNFNRFYIIYILFKKFKKIKTTITPVDCVEKNFPKNLLFVLLVKGNMFSTLLN